MLFLIFWFSLHQDFLSGSFPPFPSSPLPTAPSVWDCHRRVIRRCSYIQMPSIIKMHFRRIGFQGNHARQGWVEHHCALCNVGTRTPAGAHLIAHSVPRCTSIPKAVRALDMMERWVAKTKSLEGSHRVCVWMNQHIHRHYKHQIIVTGG